MSRFRFTLARTAALGAALALAAASAEAAPARTFARGAREPFMAIAEAKLPAALSPRAALTRLLPHAAAAELDALPEVPLAGGERVVRFAQRHHGVPVIGRGATVRLDAHGRAELAIAELATRLPHSVAPRVDSFSAAETARVRTRLPSLGRGSLAILPLPDRSRLVWRFEPRFPGIPTAPRVLVDAESGELLMAREGAVAANASAHVYSANPTRSPGLELLPFPIAPTAPDRLEASTIVAKTCIDRGKVLEVPGIPSGIRACDLESIATPSASGDYVAPPNDEAGAGGRNEDAFAEISMFYHLGRVYSMFERLAPAGTKRVVDSAPFTAIANLRIAEGLEGSGDPTRFGDPNLPLAPFSNAFFAPGGDAFAGLYGVEGGALWFGQGSRRDYAYDGDVVYHEFTHAVIDATLGLGFFAFDEQGLSAAPGALNEGLADVFAAALSGDPDVGEYAASDLHDGLPYVRTLANDDRCPRQIVGEVHFDSTAFSGALWAARSTLSDVERVVFDRTLYEVMLTQPRFDAPTFEQFFAVMLETFRTRSSLATRALETELAARGLWPRCERVLEATNRSVTAPTDAAGRIGFQAPGRFETGLAFIPGTVTFRASVVSEAPGPQSLVVDFRGRTRQTALFFEADGTPFSPVVLVRFDDPITFDGARHEATELRPKADESSVTIPVPAGARVAYVQIANEGEKSGIYDAVTLKLVPLPKPPTSVAASEEPAPPPQDGGGCAIAPPGAAAFEGLLVAIAALLRRRSTRR